MLPLQGCDKGTDNNDEHSQGVVTKFGYRRTKVGAIAANARLQKLRVSSKGTAKPPRAAALRVAMPKRVASLPKKGSLKQLLKGGQRAAQDRGKGSVGAGGLPIRTELSGTEEDLLRQHLENQRGLVFNPSQAESIPHPAPSDRWLRPISRRPVPVQRDASSKPSYPKMPVENVFARRDELNVSEETLSEGGTDSPPSTRKAAVVRLSSKKVIKPSLHEAGVPFPMFPMHLGPAARKAGKAGGKRASSAKVHARSVFVTPTIHVLQSTCESEDMITSLPPASPVFPMITNPRDSVARGPADGTHNGDPLASLELTNELLAAGIESKEGGVSRRRQFIAVVGEKRNTAARA
jgi:hypothetical protein